MPVFKVKPFEGEGGGGGGSQLYLVRVDARTSQSQNNITLFFTITESGIDTYDKLLNYFKENSIIKPNGIPTFFPTFEAQGAPCTIGGIAKHNTRERISVIATEGGSQDLYPEAFAITYVGQK